MDSLEGNEYQAIRRAYSPGKRGLKSYLSEVADKEDLEGILDTFMARSILYGNAEDDRLAKRLSDPVKAIEYYKQVLSSEGIPIVRKELYGIYRSSGRVVADYSLPSFDRKKNKVFYWLEFVMDEDFGPICLVSYAIVSRIALWKLRKGLFLNTKEKGQVKNLPLNVLRRLLSLHY